MSCWHPLPLCAPTRKPRGAGQRSRGTIGCLSAPHPGHGIPCGKSFPGLGARGAAQGLQHGSLASLAIKAH